MTYKVQGEAIGTELRSQGANLFGGVSINLARHPGWGRAQESYGEGPLVLGAFGAALSRGITKNVMACVKQHALNSMKNMRFKFDVTYEEKTLNECYLPHFKQAIEEGSAECVMTAYNKLNGTHCGECPQLMDIPRKQWGSNTSSLYLTSFGVSEMGLHLSKQVSMSDIPLQL
jgi:beta-glucosidase